MTIATYHLYLDSSGLDPFPPAANPRPMMESVILASLLSDATDPDYFGTLGGYRGGWAGDLPTTDAGVADETGSLLWLLNRAKLTEATILRAQEYATSALQWLVSDGIASSLAVVVTREGMGLAINVTLVRGAATAHAYLWGDA